MPVIMSGGLQAIVAVGVVAPSNATTLFMLTTARATRVRIVKIKWHNRGVVNSMLQIGYEDNVAAPGGPNFIQVLPDILMLPGVDDQYTEEEIPLCGNTPEGFAVDNTVAAGCTGDIMAEATVAAAAPADVQVEIEVEEI